MNGFSDDSSRLWRGRRAATALEFAIVGPVFLLLLFAVLGVGLDGFYQLTLDDAVRNAARQVQIDGPAATSPAGFASAVCAEFAALARGCTTSLTFSVQASALAAGFGAMTPATLSSAGQFASSSSSSAAFFAGTAYADNDNILVQVAYPLPFKLPYVSSLITNTGTGSIVASSTVRAEPF